MAFEDNVMINDQKRRSLKTSNMQDSNRKRNMHDRNRMKSAISKKRLIGNLDLR